MTLVKYEDNKEKRLKLFNIIVGKFYVDKHVVKRYEDRIDKNKSGKVDESEIIYAIQQDLKTNRVKQIIHKPNGDKHIFTSHSKEFIFVKVKRGFILKTVIKRTRDNNQSAIQKRQYQAGKIK